MGERDRGERERERARAGENELSDSHILLSKLIQHLLLLLKHPFLLAHHFQLHSSGRAHIQARS